jgi:hypothetical protein
VEDSGGAKRLGIIYPDNAGGKPPDENVAQFH